MPFKSKAQMRFLFAKHPEIAKRWAAETPKDADLPQHVALRKAMKKVGKK